MAPTPYSAPTATGRLDAVVELPGSKSLTNRELVLSALADAPSRLVAPLVARDTELMAAALRSLGAGIGPDPDAPDALLVTPFPSAQPVGERERRSGAPDPMRSRSPTGWADGNGGRRIDVGLAGTVMRFVPPLAALAEGPTAFDGDETARRRPMSTMTTALRALGIEVDGDALPFVVHGAGRVRGGELTIDASASSQFVSGLLLAAPRFEEGLVLRHEGERLPSLPHIEMTLECLAARGVEVASPDEGVWIVAPGRIAGRETVIEPDLSNAAVFLAAASVAGGRVTVPHWPAASTQVGMLAPELIAAFGPAGALHGADLDLSAAGELAPTIVGLAALAASPSRIVGIGHLRGHETDRLAALVTEIERLGGTARELPDGIEVLVPVRHGGVWRSYEDHRMATTGALVGLAIPGVVVDDIGATSKTMPDFVSRWEGMLGR